MSKKIRTEAVDNLFEAILNLKNKEECYLFFEDVCTVNELLSLSQRFEVAKMLRERKTYLEIAEKTGASTATILSLIHICRTVQKEIRNCGKCLRSSLCEQQFSLPCNREFDTD